MSYALRTPAAAHSKRRGARLAMAITSAAFVSGAIALPASAAAAPETRPAALGVRSDTPPDDDPYWDSIPGTRGGSGGDDHRDPNGAYGPNSCKQGYVWQDSYDGDTLCVPPEWRQAAHDANPHRQPGGGAYGPSTCSPGYVWRDSFDGDTLCVTPEQREAAKR
ncbi:hypothetical protein ACFTWH_16060 [Streptomyces sp. NPDC057011]|uniref:hypothetical protein n=1 Tax=unclassified Streptomyces TaxID=2593676 RepID=UPI00362E331C